MKDFSEYQRRALSTAVYPNIGQNMTYPALGLCGEAGEIAEKVKKILRDRDGVIDEESMHAIKKELGDVLWYIAVLAYEFGLDLQDVAESNLWKLEDRKNRGVLQGSGDNR